MDLPTRHLSRLVAALAAGALTAGITLAAGMGPAQAANGTLSGTVTELGTGAPLGGVTVEAFCWSVTGTPPGEVCGTTVTAANGSYSLSLAPGIYKISYDDWPAHARQFYGGGTTIGDPSSAEVTVPSGGSVTGIDVALVLLQTVSGTVTGTGTPIGGINVTAYEHAAGPPPSWEPAGDAVTEIDGTYALHVPDGTYRVGFSDAHGPYQTLFYDGATTVEAADDVVVDADVADIDADLERGFPITGSVTVDGVDMPAVTVTAYQATAPGVWDAVKFTETGLDGRYALYLPNGTYRVSFQTWQGRFPTQFYPSADTIEQGADVVVAGAEVPGISAAIVSGPVDTGPAIRGTVTEADGGAPVAGVSVSTWRFEVAFGSWVQVRVKQTGPDGTYAVYVPEGTYRVGFTDYANRYQPEFYDGAATVEDADDVVQVTAGVTGIDADLVANSSISGVVTADPVPDLPPGPPPTEVTAWTWDNSALDWVSTTSAYAGPDGRYQLFVPDGTYRIGFRTDIDGFEQPLFYDGTDSVGQATDVVLDGADVTGINAHWVVESGEPPPTWSPTRTLSIEGNDAWDPRVAVSPRGTAIAVWSDRGSGRVQASTRQKSGSWNEPFFLSPPREDAFDPRVAIGPHGRCVVVWRRWDGTHYRVDARTRPQRQSWSARVTLSGAAADAWDPQVAVGRGRAVVVWRSAGDAGSDVQASARDARGAWSAPATLSGDQDAWDPQVSVATDNSAVVVWSRSGPAHLRVQAIGLSKAGGWSLTRTLSAPGRDAEDPQVAVTPHGAATVVWRSSGGPVERIQAVRHGSGGRWSKPVALSAVHGDAYDPQVAMDAGGTATVVWSRWDGSSDRVQVSSRAPGRRWSTPETLSDGGWDGTSPQVAASPDGKTAVVWHEAVPGSEYVLAAISYPGWTWSAPTVLATSDSAVSGPHAAAGVDGTVATVWERRIDGIDRVQGAVRFDPGGLDHCHNVFGVDLNIVFGVPDQFVDYVCRTVNGGSRWRPLTLWIMNTAFEQVPPDFVPAGATPLEDLLAKLESITVVIDPGTRSKKVVVFSPARALRTDRTFAEYDPSAEPLPLAASLPRLGPLPLGKHTVKVIWSLNAQHCDGSGLVEADNCLAAGNVPMWTRVIRVRRR